MTVKCQFQICLLSCIAIQRWPLPGKYSTGRQGHFTPCLHLLSLLSSYPIIFHVFFSLRISSLLSVLPNPLLFCPPPPTSPLFLCVSNLTLSSLHDIMSYARMSAKQLRLQWTTTMWRLPLRQLYSGTWKWPYSRLQMSLWFGEILRRM